MTKQILDTIAAKRAQTIVNNAIAKPKLDAKDVDNLVTKTLGVLQENGVYACFLFLSSRSRGKDKKVAEAIRAQLLELSTEDLPFGWELSKGRDDKLEYVSDVICAELDPLLMTKNVFEQTLIYARYGAKARDQQG
ncbi:MAG: hypothetical protein U9Q82_04550, partial [Chloroflexota bacterium]|nr:hypothetical protein [Chloroflexota bacterium]